MKQFCDLRQITFLLWLVFPSVKDMGLYLDQWFSNLKYYPEVYVIKISLKIFKAFEFQFGRSLPSPEGISRQPLHKSLDCLSSMDRS